MTDAVAPTASPTATPEANGSGVIPTLDERSAAVFGTSDPAVEGSATPPGETSAAGSAEPDANAKARAERRIALERLKHEERGRVDAMSALRERDELRRKLAEMETASKARSNLIDVDSLDEEGLLGLLERSKKVSPQRIGERLRELIANPELAAAQAATRIVDPKLSALEKDNAELRARLDAFDHAQASARAEAEERQYAEQFFAFTRENSAASPYSARFLEKHGANEFYKLAQRAVQLVPPHAGAQAILDEIEENLSQLGAIYITPEQGVTQRRQAPPTHQNHAAAQAPTHVSNTLAQQRSSVVDEDEQWAALPFEERSARLFR